MAPVERAVPPDVNGPHRWSVRLVGGVVVLGVGELVLRLLLGSALNGLNTLSGDLDRVAASADQFRLLADGIALVQGAVFVAAAIAVLVWVHRAWRAVPLLGSGPMRWSASWAVGAWFVPILNLWRPVQVIGDLNRSSRELSEGRPGNAWRDARFGSTVWVWWLCLIIVGRLEVTSVRWELRAERLEGLEWIDLMMKVAWLDAVSGALFAISGLMLIRVVRRVTRRALELRRAIALKEQENLTDSA